MTLLLNIEFCYNKVLLILKNMPIIYNSIADEIRRKCESKENIEPFLLDLFNLYKPKDKNKNGDNLLTIFLNEANRNNPFLKTDLLISKFLDRNFKIQTNRIKSRVWDTIIEYFIETNTIKNLPKYLEEKSEYFYLMLPTTYTKKLMEHFYKKNKLMYDDNKKFNILDYIFDKDLTFNSKSHVMNYVAEMEDILTNLFINKNLSDNHLSILDDEKFINTFTYCVEKKLLVMQNIQNINALLGHNDEKPLDFNSVEYLKKLKATIFSELLKADLLVNEPTSKTKKTNKI